MRPPSCLVTTTHRNRGTSARDWWPAAPASATPSCSAAMKRGSLPGSTPPDTLLDRQNVCSYRHEPAPRRARQLFIGRNAMVTTSSETRGIGGFGEFEPAELSENAKVVIE